MFFFKFCVIYYIDKMFKKNKRLLTHCDIKGVICYPPNYDKISLNEIYKKEYVSLYKGNFKNFEFIKNSNYAYSYIK